MEIKKKVNVKFKTRLNMMMILNLAFTYKYVFLHAPLVEWSQVVASATAE